MASAAAIRNKPRAARLAGASCCQAREVTLCRQARGDTVHPSWARLSGVSAEGLPPIPVTITAEGTTAE